MTGAIEVETVVGALWADAGDTLITPVIRRKGRWEFEVSNVLVHVLRPGMAFVDVGANIGYFSVLASRRVGERGRVFAVEPDPYTVRLLEANLSRNGCANVSVLRMAAAAATGTVPFAVATEGRSGSSIRPGSTSLAAVPSARLDDVLGDEEVDVMKVDVEGAEPWVLRGAEAIIRRSRELTIVVEFRPTLPQGGLEPLEALALYRSLGLELYAIRRDGRVTPAEPAELVEQRSEGSFTNIVLRKAYHAAAPRAHRGTPRGSPR